MQYLCHITETLYEYEFDSVFLLTVTNVSKQQQIIAKIRQEYRPDTEVRVGELRLQAIPREDYLVLQKYLPDLSLM